MKKHDQENNSQKDFVFSMWMNLQRYDMSVSTSDMRPTEARAHHMNIPVFYLIIGIIEFLQQINQSFTFILAEIVHNDPIQSVNR